MPYYKKRPVTIEARPFPGFDEDYNGSLDIFMWIAKEHGIVKSSDRFTEDETMPKHGVAYNDDTLEIFTLEGVLRVSPDDMVIKGVNNEFYPCKPDIFEKTYELLPKPEHEHKVVQHRDAKEPWCDICGKNASFEAPKMNKSIDYIIKDYRYRKTGYYNVPEK